EACRGCRPTGPPAVQAKPGWNQTWWYLLMGRMTVAPAFQGARLAWPICRYEAGNSSTRLGGGSASVTPGADTITAVCVRNRLTRGNVRAVFSVGTGRGVRVKVNKLVA